MKPLFVLLLLAFTAYGQKRIAIINTVDDGEPPVGHSELSHLTDRLREIAVKTLPQGIYVMTQESIVAFLGSQERAAKECKEATCLAELGRKVNADYVAQARIGRFGGNLTIKTELYDSKSGNLLGSFTGFSEDIFGLLTILDEKAPGMFKRMPDVTVALLPVVGGISDLEKVVDYEKRYLAYLSTEPSGAILSFDGEPAASCAKTPCKTELREGNVRIIAALELYETADTAVSITRNSQNIAIALKPNFGVLEIKPAYLDGIGKDEEWDLTINDKAYYSFENNLSPNKYEVELNHKCYENISFKAGIDKGKRKVFDMSSHIALKKGNLVLNAERDGKPASEPIFVNGKQIGKTPFSGSVLVCAKVEIGKSRDMVDVQIEHKQTVTYTHRTISHTYRDESLQNEPPPAPKSFDASSIYFSFYRPSITSFYGYKDQKLKRNGLNVMFGGESISRNSLFGGGIFIGGGALGKDIKEFILGLEVKKLFWLLEERIGIPVSIGFGYRYQWMDIENKLVAEFINVPEFQQEPDDYLNKKRDMGRHSLDIIPSIDLQIFIGSSFSIYAGYMYRTMPISSNWKINYKIPGKDYTGDKKGDKFTVPEEFNPLKNSKEQIFGKSGTLRFGMKIH
jgi:TolB-like protein